jgi:hypothetical protein
MWRRLSGGIRFSYRQLKFSGGIRSAPGSLVVESVTALGSKFGTKLAYTR